MLKRLTVKMNIDLYVNFSGEQLEVAEKPSGRLVIMETKPKVKALGGFNTDHWSYWKVTD